MRYIRFLKPPRIIQDKSSSQAHISCLITITSDLGDSFLPFDLTLSAELIHRRNGVEEVLVWKIVQWTGAMRSLAISLPLSKSRRTWPLRVRIGTEPKSTYDEFSKLLQEDSRGVVSAWSTEIDPSKSVHEAEKLIERRIDVELKTPIIIWEETGESIARHLWDAGITLSCNIHDVLGIASDDNFLPFKGDHQPFRVIELGTGCGIVGITIAQSIRTGDILLTDLIEARAITEKNISCNKYDNAVTPRFEELVWDEDPPNAVPSSTTSGPHSAQTDLIVAADCTYNPDSSPALVNTMHKIAEASPRVLVAIAMKIRHASEAVFFDLMTQAGFSVSNKMTFPLPGDHEPGEETVDLYLYHYKGDATVL